jgi:hypothetical protein
VPGVVPGSTGGGGGGGVTLDLLPHPSNPRVNMNKTAIGNTIARRGLRVVRRASINPSKTKAVAKTHNPRGPGPRYGWRLDGCSTPWLAVVVIVSMVDVATPLSVKLEGANAAVLSFGNPDALKLMVLGKPPVSGVTVMLKVPD